MTRDEIERKVREAGLECVSKNIARNADESTVRMVMSAVDCLRADGPSAEWIMDMNRRVENLETANNVGRESAKTIAAEARCRELEGASKADNARLVEAGTRVGILFGCDTPDMMADEILNLRDDLANSKHDADKCAESANIFRSRAEAAEAKLAVAVEALRRVCDQHDDRPDSDCECCIAAHACHEALSKIAATGEPK